VRAAGTLRKIAGIPIDSACDEHHERKDDDQGRFIKAVQGVVGKGLRYSKLIGQEGGDGLPPTQAAAW